MDFNSKPFRVIKAVVAVFIGLIVLTLLRSFIKPTVNKAIDSASSIESTNDKAENNSTKKRVGTSNLYILSSLDLIKSDVPYPQEMLDNLTKVETYEFEKSSIFSGKISYLVWKDGINYDTETGARGTIENIKRLDGIEKTIEKITPFSKKNLEGHYIDITYFRYGNSAILKGAVIKSGQETWAISVTSADTSNSPFLQAVVQFAEIK